MQTNCRPCKAENGSFKLSDTKINLLLVNLLLRSAVAASSGVYGTVLPVLIRDLLGNCSLVASFPDKQKVINSENKIELSGN